MPWMNENLHSIYQTVLTVARDIRDNKTKSETRLCVCVRAKSGFRPMRLWACLSLPLSLSLSHTRAYVLRSSVSLPRSLSPSLSLSYARVVEVRLYILMLLYIICLSVNLRAYI